MSAKVCIQNIGEVPLRVRGTIAGPDGKHPEAPPLPPGMWCELTLLGQGVVVEPVTEPESTEGAPA